jgi:hypothetical protein
MRRGRGARPRVPTLYSCNPETEVAALLEADRMEIPPLGRDLAAPMTITLSQVPPGVNPTGPAEPSTDDSESMCPQ